MSACKYELFRNQFDNFNLRNYIPTANFFWVTKQNFSCTGALNRCIVCSVSGKGFLFDLFYSFFQLLKQAILKTTKCQTITLPNNLIQCFMVSMSIQTSVNLSPTCRVATFLDHLSLQPSWCNESHFPTAYSVCSCSTSQDFVDRSSL